MKIKAGVTAWDQVGANNTIFSEVMQAKGNAYDELTQLNLSKILKPRKVMKDVEDVKNIHVQMDGNLPIGECGDGVEVNEKSSGVNAIIFPHHATGVHSMELMDHGNR